MAVTATSPMAKLTDEIKNLIAESTVFQSEVGEQDAAGAKEHIYLVAHEPDGALKDYPRPNARVAMPKGTYGIKKPWLDRWQCDFFMEILSDKNEDHENNFKKAANFFDGVVEELNDFGDVRVGPTGGAVLLFRQITQMKPFSRIAVGDPGTDYWTAHYMIER